MKVPWEIVTQNGDYEYIKKKAEGVFYDPKVTTEIVDEVLQLSMTE